MLHQTGSLAARPSTALGHLDEGARDAQLLLCGQLQHQIDQPGEGGVQHLRKDQRKQQHSLGKDQVRA